MILVPIYIVNSVCDCRFDGFVFGGIPVCACLGVGSSENYLTLFSSLFAFLYRPLVLASGSILSRFLRTSLCSGLCFGGYISCIPSSSIMSQIMS